MFDEIKSIVDAFDTFRNSSEKIYQDLARITDQPIITPIKKLMEVEPKSFEVLENFLNISGLNSLRQLEGKAISLQDSIMNNSAMIVARQLKELNEESFEALDDFFNASGINSLMKLKEFNDKSNEKILKIIELDMLIWINQVQNFRLNINNYFENINSKKEIYIGAIWEALPSNINELIEAFVIDNANAVIYSSAYSFMASYLRREKLLEFADVSLHIEPAITNKFRKITRSDIFKEKLKHLFASEPVIGKRWDIINRALDAHNNSDYIVSIPLFLMQLEGIIGDMLIIRQRATRHGNKVMSVKPNKKGKLYEIKGMQGLLQSFDSSDLNNRIDLCRDVLINELITERNGIVHGRNIKYFKPKLSIRLLLLIYAFSSELAAFSTGDGWNTNKILLD